jgi:hypothetical protein
MNIEYVAMIWCECGFQNLSIFLLFSFVLFYLCFFLLFINIKPFLELG